MLSNLDYFVVFVVVVVREETSPFGSVFVLTDRIQILTEELEGREQVKCVGTYGE